MTIRYKQLGSDERVALSTLHMQGVSLRSKAAQLQRSPSTIRRELRRNAAAGQPYRADAARHLSTSRRCACSTAPQARPRRAALARGKAHALWLWSPRQIACTTRRIHPEESHLQVSHDTLYNAIYGNPKGELRS